MSKDHHNWVGRRFNGALERATEAEGVGVFAQGSNAKGDVLVERDAEFFGTFYNVFATDAAREGFVFHALFHGTDFEVEDAFRGTYVSAGA